MKTEKGWVHRKELGKLCLIINFLYIAHTNMVKRKTKKEGNHTEKKEEARNYCHKQEILKSN